MKSEFDNVLDKLLDARGPLALFQTIQQDSVFRSAELISAAERRIHESRGLGDLATAQRLQELLSLLEDLTPNNSREAFQNFFSRHELAVAPHILQMYREFGASVQRPDRGLALLQFVSAGTLHLFQEMLERQIVSMKVDGDLFFHRMLEERLEFLATYQSGCRPRVPEENERHVEDQEMNGPPEIVALYEQSRAAATPFLRQGIPAALDDAISLLETARNSPGWEDASPSLREHIREGQASLMASRFNVSGQAEDLARAIDIWVDLAGHASDDGIRLSAVQNGAIALIWQSERYDLPNRLDDSIDLLKRVALNGDAIANANLASLALRRYEQKAQLADLELATSASSIAIASSDIGNRGLPAAFVALSGAFLYRYAQSNLFEHARLALRYADDAIRLLDTIPRDAGLLLMALTARGRALVEVYHATQGNAFLDDAIETLGRAAGSAPPGSSSWVQASVEFAKALTLGPGGDASDLQRVKAAVDLLRTLSKDARLGPRDQLLVSMELAGALIDHWRRADRDESRVEALELWEKGCRRDVAERNLPWALIAARNLGQFALECGEWKTAAEAFTIAIEYVEELVTRNVVVRRHRGAVLSQTYGVAALGAYALARDSRPIEAVLALERGRTFGLSFSLYAREQELQRLEELGRQDLTEALRLTAEALWSEQEVGEALEDVHALSISLSGLIEEVRRIPGFETFMSPPSADDLFSDLEAPVVYLAATAFGGLALIVTAPDQVKVVLLPELTEHELIERLKPLHLDDNGRPMAAFSSADQAQRLEDVLSWLWPVCMGPVVEYLMDAGKAVLIPTGYLALLPLEAAYDSRLEGGEAAKTYVLNHLTLRFTPNARLLVIRASPRVTPALRSAAVLGDPLPSTARRLKAARAEVMEIAALVEGSNAVLGTSVTQEGVLHAIGAHRIFHFAGHAFIDMDEPLESFLLVAEDERVTARSILEHPNDLHLAVLSACQTAAADLRHVDEVVSLGASFLQAGTTGVIASLWVVDDAATLMLMVQFYRCWKNGALLAPEALAEAKRWMYSSSGDEKRSTYSELLAGAGFEVSTLPWSRYEHPLYWAAFTYWGA